MLIEFCFVLKQLYLFIFGCAGSSLLPGFSLAVVHRLLFAVAYLAVEL